MKTDKVLTNLWPEVVLSLLVLIVFFISVDTYQYLTTEVWWLWDETSFTYNTWFLLSLIVLGAFTPMNKWLVKWPKLAYLIVGLFLVTIFAHQRYSHFYDQLQKIPKIRGLSKEWGIPGSWVKVTGKNFGEEAYPGKVYLGDKEMTIKKWGEKEVIFEINMEAEGGEQELHLINKHDKTQKEIMGFEVR